MHPLLRLIRRYSLFLPALVLMALVVGGLAYLAITMGTRNDSVRVIGTSIVISPLPPIGTPIARFAGVDPAIIPYLEGGQPRFGVNALEVLGQGIPPVGAFLPRAGNAQFKLVEPTPMPTPLYYPTSPPLPYPTSPPVPTIAGPIIPTLSAEMAATIQAFGVNVTPVGLPYMGAECPPSGLPVEGILTQRFHSYHSGIDLGVPSGSPVYTTQSGIVTWADWNTFGYGNLVIIQSGRFITYYAHLTSPNVLLGDVVGKNSIIGWSGSTGNSSGPHVHYETRIDDIPVDPLTFEARGLGTC